VVHIPRAPERLGPVLDLELVQARQRRPPRDNARLVARRVPASAMFREA
jgi:hypothetical protein